MVFKATAVLKRVGKKSFVLRLLMLLGVASFGGMAHAAPASDLVLDRAIEHVIDGNSLGATPTAITTQFSSPDVTFIPPQKGAVRFDVCGAGIADATAHQPAMPSSNFGPNCRIAPTKENFSMRFNFSVSAEAYGYYLYIANQLRPQMVRAMLRGTDGVTYNLPFSVVGAGQSYAVISSGGFDQLRFIDETISESIIAESLAFIRAASPGPTPATMTLIFLGLLSLVRAGGRKSH